LRGGLLELVLEGFFAAESGFGDCLSRGILSVLCYIFGLSSSISFATAV
jgi:hypothetical protein